MIEDMLRETFTSHEALAPAPGQVRARIAVAARRRRRRRYIGGTAVALLALIVGTLIRPDAVRLPTVAERPAAPSQAPITFLLVGIDGGPGPADAVVLAHVPAGGGVVYLISVPRDVVPAGGDVAAVRAAVTARTRVPIDGTAEVDVAGLVAVVDAVGGVDLCVDVRVVSARRPGVVYEPGCRRFTGAEALDYARQRYGMPDGDRGRRDLLEAVYGKLAGADLTTVAQVARAAGNDLRLDLGAYRLPELFDAVRNLTPDDVHAIDAPSDDLWTAVITGTLSGWLAAHPDQVS